MAHFDPEVWIDYVRGLGKSETTEALEHHLEAGCADCLGDQRSFLRMVRLLEEEGGRGVPDMAVDSVKAVFGLERGLEAGGAKPHSVELVLDPATAAAGQGTRSVDSRGQQYLFESDVYSLDVRLDRESGSNELLVRGQLLHRRGEPIPRAAAYLQAGGTVTAATVTCGFGSFTLRTARQPPVGLWLLPDAAHRIAVEVGTPPRGRAEDSEPAS